VYVRVVETPHGVIDIENAFVVAVAWVGLAESFTVTVIPENTPC
jgi:hypothetical protein